MARGERRERKKERERRDRTRSSGEPDPPRRGAVREWGQSLLIAFVLFVVLRTFVVQTFVITSGSMMDTLLVGDFLVVNRAAIGSPVPFTGLRVPGYSEPHRFDILVFDPPHEVDQMLVKRLVGMPGDTLQMRDGALFIDGERIDEPYVRNEGGRDEPHPGMVWQRDYLTDSVDRASYAPTRDDWGPLVVPEDRYFMLGDNRQSSLDSRYWGLLEGWRLEGRAVFIYFSYDTDTTKPFPAVTATRPERIGDIIR